MAHTKQTEVRKETIDRLKQRIGLDLATIYVNYGMPLNVHDKLMECMHSKRSESFRRAPNYSSNFLHPPDS